MSKDNNAKNIEIHVKRVADINVNDLGVRSRGQRRRVSIEITEPSLTKQADFDRANIHSLLSRFQKSGHIRQVTAQPLQGGIPDVDSFHEAMNIVTTARQSFDALPSQIREKFENNPAKMLQFVSDEKNQSELVALGLAVGSQPAGEGGKTSPANNDETGGARAHNAGAQTVSSPEGAQ